jgi:hypothetical protein
MNKEALIKEAMQIRSRLFSFGGNETGNIAVTLHQACNCILDAKEQFEDFQENFSLH